MLFVELPYTLATEEAERIGLDHMARMSTNESGESSLGLNYFYLCFFLFNYILFLLSLYTAHSRKIFIVLKNYNKNKNRWNEIQFAAKKWRNPISFFKYQLPEVDGAGVFPKQWIGCGGRISWTLRSPDITSLDFFLLDYVKGIVYQTAVSNIFALKERMQFTILIGADNKWLKKKNRRK